MAFDNAYEAITEDNNNDDSHWVFGTKPDDPLAGMDTSIPSTVDSTALAAYCLMLGDDALIFSHRLQQWCAKAPELEDEVAIANIALDLLGQARLLLSRAGKADGSARGEDALAFFRTREEFRHVTLAEASGGHFGQLIARLLVFSTWRLALMQRLVSTTDPILAAIAQKAVKEISYHRDYAAQWAVRLGDGTELSHRRMQEALDTTWPYVEELFTDHEHSFVELAEARHEFDAVLEQVMKAATLRRPSTLGESTRGRMGEHTEQFAPLLAELQGVAREHPEATW